MVASLQDGWVDKNGTHRFEGLYEQRLKYWHLAKMDYLHDKSKFSLSSFLLHFRLSMYHHPVDIRHIYIDESLSRGRYAWSLRSTPALEPIPLVYRLLFFFV